MWGGEGLTARVSLWGAPPQRRVLLAGRIEQRADDPEEQQNEDEGRQHAGDREPLVEGGADGEEGETEDEDQRHEEHYCARHSRDRMLLLGGRGRRIGADYPRLAGSTPASGPTPGRACGTCWSAW